MHTRIETLRLCRFAVLVLGVVVVSVAPEVNSSASAQETARQKGRIECWIKCCPWEIGCQWVPGTSSTRTADELAGVTIKGSKLYGEFKPNADQKVFEVKQATKLSADTVKALGYKEVTLLPGQYPLSVRPDGRATVTISVKAVAAAQQKNLNSSKSN